jgi:twitching motility protein PilT
MRVLGYCARSLAGAGTVAGGRRQWEEAMLDLTALLRTLAENSGSDLHLVAGSAPLIRVDGELMRLEGKALTPEDTALIAHTIMPPDRREDLERRREADFAHSLTGVGRFRVNVFRQRGSISLVMRRVRTSSASFESLGLPSAVQELADVPRGLVLVTGPTGSGKTTTLAAMIDHINNTKPVHILTVEDPIEVLHSHKRASINQREIGVDTDSYAGAMRAAMRQDPDVILIGEMRDSDTVAAALAAAETGHFVMSTLHTTDAVESVNRIVDFFPPFQQHQVRVTLASVLRGIVSQRLVQRVGGGRIPALEIMVNNGRVAERIIDSNTTPEIRQIIAEGEFYGMQSFDQSLLALVKQGMVEPKMALEAATEEHDLRMKFEQAGIAIAA